MIVTLPVVIPVATPVLLMVAMVLLLLSQLPPVVVLLNVTLAPTHTADGPVMVPAEVGEPTFTTWVAVSVPQLLVTVYIIVSKPALMPPVTPVDSTTALPLVALHVPPAMPLLVKGMPEPIQTLPLPEITPASGNGLTVTLRVAAVAPQPVVTV